MKHYSLHLLKAGLCAMAVLTFTPNVNALSWIEKNDGQSPTAHDYIIRAQGMTALTRNTYVDLMLEAPALSQASTRLEFSGHSEREMAPSPSIGDVSRVRLQFVGANPKAGFGPSIELTAKSNYFKGSKESWVANVPHFSEVSYKDVYPGIDVVYRLASGKLEYDFIVAAGADASMITLKLDGASGANVTSSGVLEAQVPSGTLQQSIPSVYQVIDGKKTSLHGAFQVTDDGYIGFELSGHNEEHAIVIDPVIELSGYFSGLRTERAFSMVPAENGNYILSGTTTSLFNAVDVPADVFPDSDVFVVEINASTGEPEWVTILGGLGTERSSALKVDGLGNIVLVGRTGSSDYPILNAFQSEFVGNNTDSTSVLNSDGFITKLSPNGSSLVFSTFLGGTDTQIDGDQNFGYEDLRGLDFDGQQNVYVLGQTAATDFPVTTKLNGSACFELDAEPGNPLQGTFASDVVIAKFSPEGDRIASTCLGASALDTGRDIRVTEGGSVLLAGYTRSPDFPTTEGAFQQQPLTELSFTPFVLKLSANLDAVEWSTLIGEGQLQRIDVDASGSVYGATTSFLGLSPVTPGAYQSSFSDDPNEAVDGEGYVFKLNESGSTLEYGTYLGALGDDYLSAVVVDDKGRAIVAGYTESPHFPLVNGLPFTSDPTLANTNTGTESPGNNRIERFSLFQDGLARMTVTLIARNGANGVGFGEGGSVGPVFPFAPLADQFDTAAMTYRQDFLADDYRGYVVAANRDGPNQLFSFDLDELSFAFIASVGEVSTDSRAVLTDLQGFSSEGQTAFLLANYGGQNSLLRIPGEQPEAFTVTPVGRPDGQSTALANLFFSTSDVTESYTVVANEFQDIRLYSQALDEPVVLNHPVGAVSDLAVARLLSDAINVEQLVIANKDRPVEVLFFDPLQVSNPSVVTLDDTGTGNLSVAVADVDNDGNDDILVGRTEQDMLFMNDGAGGFTRDASYTGSSEPTKHIVDRLPSQTSRICPCFAVTDSRVQEITPGSADVFISVLSPTGEALEMSTRIAANGEDELFRGLGFASGSDSKLLLSASSTGNQWPRVNTVTNAAGGSDAVFMVLELDQDGDSALDGSDNCTQMANGSQTDTDADGYGNACDADFNNDCVVNFLDVSQFANEFAGSNQLFDLNDDGKINFLDFAVVSAQFLSPPGPGLGNCESTL